MDELPSSLASLLDEARSAHDPSAEDARRVARALSVAIPGFAASALGGSSGLAGVDASAQAVAQAASTVSQSAVASKGVFAGLASMKWLGLLIVMGGLGTMATVQDRPSEHAEAKPHGVEQTLALNQSAPHTSRRPSGLSRSSAGEPGRQAAPTATPVMGSASNEAADTQEHASSPRPVPTRDDGSVPGVPPPGAEPSRGTLTILSKAARTRKPATSGGASARSKRTGQAHGGGSGGHGHRGRARSDQSGRRGSAPRATCTRAAAPRAACRALPTRRTPAGARGDGGGGALSAGALRRG